MKSRINRGFRRLTNGNLATFASQVHLRMTGNPHFPTPIPPLADLQAQIEVYESACARFEKGNKTLLMEREQERAKLLDMLVQLAQYVELTANLEDVLLITSGFELVKTPTPRPIPSTPVIIAIEDGVRSGQVKIKVNVNGHITGLTTSYKITGSTDKPNYKFGETKKTFYIDGLEPGKYYTYQVCAANPAGESGWSAEQSFLVR